jgi:acylphosphatase
MLYCRLVVRYRVLIAGQVQGVGFRITCRRVALKHGVQGWVRNLPDGRVEASFEGPPDEVEHLLEWARHGPQLAVVTNVTVHAEPPEGLASFQIR